MDLPIESPRFEVQHHDALVPERLRIQVDLTTPST